MDRGNCHSGDVNFAFVCWWISWLRGGQTKQLLRSQFDSSGRVSARTQSRGVSALVFGALFPGRRSMLCCSAILLTIGVAFYSIGGQIEASATTGSSMRHPVSISFPASRLGFALLISDCQGQTCIGLQRTRDAGATWSRLAVPVDLATTMKMISWATYPTVIASGTLAVHFADARDGWIYGVTPAPATATTNPNYSPRLWSTHDSGASWQQISLGTLKIGDGVLQMATHGAVTYLYGASFATGLARILSTTNSLDNWTSATRSILSVPAGGTQLQGSFTFAGTRGWFVAGNDRGFETMEELTPSGTWTNWPVKSLALGEGFVPVAAESNKKLLIVASSSGFVVPAPNTAPSGWGHGATWLFESTNAGKTFRAIHELASSSKVIFPFENGLPATAKPGTILVEREFGTDTTTFELVASTNDGRSWRVVIGERVLQVTFAAPSIGYAIVFAHSDPRLSELRTTVDGGLHWADLAL